MSPIIQHGYATKRRTGSTRAWRQLRNTIIANTTHCSICHQPLTGPTDIDHITPLSAGGTSHPTNLRATHRTCNRTRPQRY